MNEELNKTAETSANDAELRSDNIENIEEKIDECTEIPTIEKTPIPENELVDEEPKVEAEYIGDPHDPDFNKLKEDAGRVIEEAKKIGTETWEAAKEKTAALLSDDAKEKLAELGEDTKEAWESLKEKSSAMLSEEGKEKLNEAKETAIETSKALGEEAVKLFGKLKNKIKDFTEKKD